MHFTLCDMFSDLTQNSIEAHANKVTLIMHIDPNRVSFEIHDNGKGMNKDLLKQVTDPFYTDGIKHPGRKVGLGIPFLIQTAQTTDGYWHIDSTTGTNDKKSGTSVFCKLNLQHLDTPPLGDVASFFRQILSFDACYEMIIKGSITDNAQNVSNQKNTNSIQKFEFVRSELLEALGLQEEGKFTDVQALSLLRLYIEDLLTEE